MKTLINALSVLVLLSMLAACGGGSGSGSTTIDAQPTIPNVTYPVTGKTGKATISIGNYFINDSAPSGNVIAVNDNIKLTQTVEFLSSQNQYTIQGFLVRDNGNFNQDETGGILLFSATSTGTANSINSDGISTYSITMVRSGETDINNGSSVVSVASLDLSKTSTAHLANGSTQAAAPMAVILKACIADTDTATGKQICGYAKDNLQFL